MAVILVVEDEPFIRQLAVMFIEDRGHQVLFAGTAEEALSILQSPQPIDALFTDIRLNMARFGGCDLAHQAVKLRPNLRVLYTSGNPQTEELRSLFVAGSYFLAKPYSPLDLCGCVDDLLAA